MSSTLYSSKGDNDQRCWNGSHQTSFTWIKEVYYYSTELFKTSLYLVSVKLQTWGCVSLKLWYMFCGDVFCKNLVYITRETKTSSCCDFVCKYLERVFLYSGRRAALCFDFKQRLRPRVNARFILQFGVPAIRLFQVIWFMWLQCLLFLCDCNVHCFPVIIFVLWFMGFCVSCCNCFLLLVIV